MKKENLPNVFSFFRIILSLCLLFIPINSFLFIAIYSVCGITDVLDGYMARKNGTESEMGARLDSIADFCMSLMIIFKLVKQTRADYGVLIGIGVILAVKTINALYSKIKFGKISSIHTVANKITGLLFFFCPLAYIFWGNVILFVTGAAALLSSAEEFLIIFTSDVPNLNRKSIFTKNKNK